ncbi:hypothetical protein ACWC4D_35930 [Streptomyces sp. NPDC001288]|uniref:hypothetical protein n=1 Tax=unclassified Streptomyces TaxID=2593676 RepID=UPI00333440A0
MTDDLHPVIAASTRWLLAAYPASGGALGRALAEAQARQAVTLAAALRYPADMDVALLHLLAPGGSDRLDRVSGGEPHHEGGAWRTWVDEAVVSWAACFLADPALAAHAVSRAETAHGHRTARDLRRLTAPGTRDTEAAALLRHPDLLENIAGLHRPQLLELLSADTADRP